MTILNSRFFTLILSFLFFQTMSQVLLQGVSMQDSFRDDTSLQRSCVLAPQPVVLQDEPACLANTSSSVGDNLASLKKEKDGAGNTFKNMLSIAVLPLDCLKKASVDVLKSPYLFLMATSALLPNAVGYGFRSILYEKLEKQRNPRASLGLTAEWDTISCQGRALNANETQTVQKQQPICRTVACMPRVQSSTLCKDEYSRQVFGRHPVLGSLCEGFTCAPHFVSRSLGERAQRDIDACVQKICSKVGKPYTGHFSCRTYKRNTHKAKKRKQINHAILKAEECFDRFCQENARDACPQASSWWQSLFGISPCNEDLCVGRFVPDEDKEIYPGFFESLEDVGYEAVRQCKKRQPYKRRCRHY